MKESESESSAECQELFPKIRVIRKVRSKSGLVPLLLLATSTADVSLDHEQQSRKQNQNAIFTRLLNLTLLITTPTQTPTYDVNENQPLVTNHLVTDSWSRTSN